MWLFVLILTSTSTLCYAQQKINPSGERSNYGFLMFENFPLNQENFKDELKILEVIKDHQDTLKTWSDFLKIEQKTFENRKNDSQLPYSGKQLLHRFYSYKTGKIIDICIDKLREKSTRFHKIDQNL